MFFQRRALVSLSGKKCVWLRAPHCSPSHQLGSSERLRGLARPSASSHLSASRTHTRQCSHPPGIPASSSAAAERKSPLFKDSWLLQEHLLFQIVMFGQFTLFIRLEINGSQSRRKVNKRLQKVLSHATRLSAGLVGGRGLVCGNESKTMFTN